MYVCMYVCTYVRMYVCMYKYMKPINGSVILYYSTANCISYVVCSTDCTISARYWKMYFLVLIMNY